MLTWACTKRAVRYEVIRERIARFHAKIVMLKRKMIESDLELVLGASTVDGIFSTLLSS